MADPASFEDYASYPADSDVPKRSLFRTFFAGIVNRIKALPTSYTGYAGEVIAVNADETGPTAASQVGGTSISFAGKEVGYLKPRVIDVSGSISVTDDDHGGCELYWTAASAGTITFDLNASPSVGISDKFECKIRRKAGSGACQIILSGSLSNANPDGHTRVKEGRPASVAVRGLSVYIDGYTET